MLTRPSGELEATMVRSFLRGANLRRWLSRPDCPPAIKRCKEFFDRAFGSKHEKHKDGEIDDISIAQFPHELQGLTLQQRGPLCSYFRFRGVLYSAASYHVGNSLIFYYPKGDMTSPVPGSIQHIYGTFGSMKFAVRRQLPATGTIQDPFSHWRRHYPAAIYSSRLGDELEEVEPSRVFCHFARWSVSEDYVVVLELSQVSGLPAYTVLSYI